MGNPNGFTESELLTRFGKSATYLGGGCYMVTYFGLKMYDSCTAELFKKYKDCFTKRGDKYFFSTDLKE